MNGSASPPPGLDWPEFIKLIAGVVTLLLAALNTFFAISIFRYKDKKDDETKERDLRSSAFRSLVLDYHLEEFYAFFDNVHIHLQKLGKKNVSLNKKEEINNLIVEELVKVRQDFVSLIQTVSDKLYDQTMKDLDGLVDGFTDTIFDGTVNCADAQVFKQHFSDTLASTRTSIVKRFVTYDGTPDEPVNTGLTIYVRD